jgi:hypothetical protein
VPLKAAKKWALAPALNDTGGHGFSRAVEDDKEVGL